ncbi:crossover junction endodeoxyribonuclease RuvC [Marinivivus vitaminiproducens]|uniref:crossover junction endodeoxyribonuclease RuvC n=1 Tax=Marinivivus vitaminiproducens TaxID=3035935 RepID=UPI0027A86668|nr:crossover junction endodeoxyribonuclease RuvC [Geminicoccaceae bacterium SCSIO 64248]
MAAIRLIGLDPGLQKTGWGVIEADGNRLRFVARGVVATDGQAPMASRLLELYRGLTEIFRSHEGHVAAVEETVVNRNPDTSLRLGHARGVILLAAAHAGMEVHEYAAKAIKRAVVGTGAAEKRQVAMMVRTLLPSAGAVTGDAADALAVAICHAHHRATALRLDAALRMAPVPS